MRTQLFIVSALVVLAVVTAGFARLFTAANSAVLAGSVKPLPVSAATPDPFENFRRMQETLRRLTESPVLKAFEKNQETLRRLYEALGAIRRQVRHVP